MASIGMDDEGSDFEIEDAIVNTNKSKKKLNIMLSDEDLNQDDVVELVKETKVNRPLIKKSTKKKSQLSLLSFAQNKVAGTLTKPAISQKSVQDIKTECPICFKSIPADKIEVHADSCADDTSAEFLEVLSSSQENQASDFLDSDIFDSGIATRVPKTNITSSSASSAKRPSWDLENSFDKPAALTSSNPSKRKRSTSPSKPMVNDVERKQFDLAPYPEFKESKMRGCLRYTGNNPGTSIQNSLKQTPATPVSSAFQTEGKLNSDAKGKGKSSGTMSNSFGFKLHPFLAQASSSSTSNDSESHKDALVPDGEGGFIIDDSVFDNSDSDGDEQFSLPPLMSNGFIDFQNQFKESSTPRTPKRKAKPKKSPKKRPWKPWRGRGRGGRGGGRNRRG